MKHIADASELQDFEYRNRHHSGNSYIRALEGFTRVTFEDIESAFNFLKMTFRGFKDERKSESFTRWQYLDTHFSDWFITNYLDEDNVNGFERKLNEDNEIELYSRMSYKVTITKYKSYIMINVKTYAHIKLLLGTIQWLDEEQAKLMIARKINAIHKK